MFVSFYSVTPVVFSGCYQADKVVCIYAWLESGLHTAASVVELKIHLFFIEDSSEYFY